MGEISKGEEVEIDIREEEEGEIGISICEEGIVEMEGTYTLEKGICEDVRGVWDVWGIDETHGEGGGVSLANSADTDGSLEVSSRIGIKIAWEKED